MWWVEAPPGSQASPRHWLYNCQSVTALNSLTLSTASLPAGILLMPFSSVCCGVEQDAFTKRTLQLVEECADVIGGDAVLEALLAIATEPDNLFNADHLDRWLQPLPMYERDIEWSTRVTHIAMDGDGDGAIETLIEWVLANGLEPIELPRARLVAITLAWLTSLSHRWVRDMATKALATLLVNRRDLAAEMIEKFASVDDAYVFDRVLAAAYGSQREIPAMRDLPSSRELPSRRCLLTTSYQPTRSFATTRVGSSSLLPIAAFCPRTYR